MVESWLQIVIATAYVLFMFRSLPQLVKVLRTGTTRDISASSYVLGVLAQTLSIVYFCCMRNFVVVGIVGVEEIMCIWILTLKVRNDKVRKSI